MVNELGGLKFKPSWFSVINQEKAIVRDQEQLIFISFHFKMNIIDGFCTIDSIQNKLEFL